MIAISAGMQKAGSAYIFNMLNDVCSLSGGADVRAIKEKYRLDGLLRHYNCNVGKLAGHKIGRLLWYSRHEGPFVVKTHAGPTRMLRFLLRTGMVKVVYIYRDPRDALLSAMDHGRKIAAAGETHTFAALSSFEDAFAAVKAWASKWQQWRDCGVYLLRYEDLLSNPEMELEKIVTYLGFAAGPGDIATTVAAYSRDEARSSKKSEYLHFNVGISSRYRSEMPEEQKQRFEREMGDLLVRMGYPRD